MNNIIALIGFSLCFSIGITISMVYAQNTTSYSPVVQSSDSLIIAVASIIGSITSVILVLVKAGILDKRIGTVAVMASDTSWAVKDSRQLIKDGMQNTYDVIKLASPETAAAADQKLAPILDDVSRRVSEYTPKVDKFADIARKLSKNKEEEITNMKDDIPDRIVPS